MTQEPTKAQQAAKQQMMEWRARNRKFRQEVAARKATERAAAQADARAAKKAAQA